MLWFSGMMLPSCVCMWFVYVFVVVEQLVLVANGSSAGLQEDRGGGDAENI